MKIYINTSNEIVETGGEHFIPGEWLHVDDSFVVDQVKYPFIKSPQTILAEKYAEVEKSVPVQLDKKGKPTLAYTQKLAAKVKEYHLDQFAAGIQQADIAYKTVRDPLTIQVLALTKAI